MESLDANAVPPPESKEADDPVWAIARAGVASGMENLEQGVIEVIKTCYDPEIPVNIFDLGLIYRVGVDAEGRVWVDMTLTAPACPVAGTLPGEVEERIKLTPGVMDAKVNLVWDPPWDQSRMSEAAKLELGLI
ncbi:MAG: SUF system Fe-S cluster assembly protein [Alphaproteobacteria bacterium]